MDDAILPILDRSTAALHNPFTARIHSYCTTERWSDNLEEACTIQLPNDPKA